ncbi:SDR family oxidoreductase [Waterburya agarophytonicola K14]|uniref:3-dehydrosphinganine reductase n=1 Tax=Waterburya agarophytonicola KI4 TaxID=2874699 RepID=A0A964BQA9_9CYAN|nr:SDR family oxidoreductase [Waterburya agarophytonicola]MCC0177619.1 SDR family oxidoreductase [Waterburya agarophytonicola KI4]
MKHAIVTGGSSGIGKATAKLLAQRGANISLIARDRSKLVLAQKEIQALTINPQQQILIFVADVSQRQQITTAIQNAIANLGTPELLITSAGIAHPGYFEEIPLEVFEKTMAVNYFGSLYAIKAALPAMEEAGMGKIVLISSGAGLIGIYGYTAYCPSKFALRGLAESLRGELKPKGVGVAIVYPPDTDTPQLAAESKIKPPETKNITATAKVWSAEAVAIEILRGIDRGRFAIAPGTELTWLNRLHSPLAPLLNWYFDRIVKQTNSISSK